MARLTVAVAKRHGGWFSSFRGRGAIPGYQFKSEEARKAYDASLAAMDVAAQQRKMVEAKRDDLAAGGAPTPVAAEQG